MMENMAEQVIELDNLVIVLSEVKDDASVPRNVRTKIESIIVTLRENTEFSIKISKALHELDSLASDVNLQSYTRTQIWNIMSSLEKLH